jgi:hypothetical protein
MKSLPPNNLGKYLTNNCQSLRLSGYLRAVKSGLKRAILSSQLEIDGYADVGLITARTGINGARLWFKCPVCGQRAGIIYRHPISGAIGCRKCLNLEYKSRRFKGMIEDPKNINKS